MQKKKKPTKNFHKQVPWSYKTVISPENELDNEKGQSR